VKSPRREDFARRIGSRSNRNALGAHQVSTAVEMGWRGISNGGLLNRAEADGFESRLLSRSLYRRNIDA